jgi:hypothetical protein
MSKLDLRIRDLNTAELLHAPFEDEVEAARWLIDRPPFIEVLGVATHGLPREVYAMLKGVARPLNDEERAISERLDAAEREEMARADEASRRQDEEEIAAYREAQKTADPNRPMTLCWSIAEGVTHDDPYDPREITAEARDAVMAWVRERDEWVRDRGQRVGEALVTAWPGPVPAGDDRVLAGGQFFTTDL